VESRTNKRNHVTLLERSGGRTKRFRGLLDRLVEGGSWVCSHVVN